MTEHENHEPLRSDHAIDATDESLLNAVLTLINTAHTTLGALQKQSRAISLAKTKLDEARHWTQDAQRGW